MTSNECRCGFVALAGSPNVGKSTLFNRLIGAHLSPVTHKPQTTRYNIRGILTRHHSQIIFVDTPGLPAGTRRYSLNRILSNNALRALSNVDVIVMMAAFNRWSPADEAMLEAVKRCTPPVFLILNKVDQATDKTELLATIDKMSQRHFFEEIFPVSALRDRDFSRFTQAISTRLPVGNFIFEEDQLSDRNERFIAAELVREQLMLELHQELPYAIHVEVERFKERKPVMYMLVVIYLGKEKQRPIVIGRSGDRLKRVGIRARRSIENLLGRRVYLELRVKTKSFWHRDPSVTRFYSVDGNVL